MSSELLMSEGQMDWLDHTEANRRSSLTSHYVYLSQYTQL